MMAEVLVRYVMVYMKACKRSPVFFSLLTFLATLCGFFTVDDQVYVGTQTLTKPNISNMYLKMQHISGKKRCTKSSPSIGWANFRIIVIIGGVLPRHIDWTNIFFCNIEKRSEMKLKLLNWWKLSKKWNSNEDWLDIEKECTAVQGLYWSRNHVRGFTRTCDTKLSMNIGQIISNTSFIHLTVSPSSICKNRQH